MGQPALVIPGFVATRPNDDARCARRSPQAGWRVHGWGMGWNLGVRADTIDRLRQRLDAIGRRAADARRRLEPGRACSRASWRARSPTGCARWSTLGSPFSGDPKQNNVWRLYELIARHKVDEPPIPRITDKPPVPTLALWSRKDGLIAPRSARGLEEERDKAVELACTHMAFGVSRQAARDVVREIQKFLEEIEGLTAYAQIGPLTPQSESRDKNKSRTKRCESCGKRLVPGRRRRCLRARPAG